MKNISKTVLQKQEEKLENLVDFLTSDNVFIWDDESKELSKIERISEYELERHLLAD